MSDFYFYSCPICQQETAGQEIGNTACGNRDCSSFMRAGARLSPLPDNSHYKQGSIDPLQYVEAIGDAEYVGACILNVVKYVTRYRFKGSALDDLAKAKDYVDKLIEHQKKKETK